MEVSAVSVLLQSTNRSNYNNSKLDFRLSGRAGGKDSQLFFQAEKCIELRNAFSMASREIIFN